MPAAAGNGDAVQHLKEVKVEGFQQSIRGALLHRQLAPRIERLLCVAENFVDGMRGVQLVIDLPGIAFIGQRQLIAQIIKAVIDRCGR